MTVKAWNEDYSNPEFSVDHNYIREYGSRILLSWYRAGMGVVKQCRTIVLGNSGTFVENMKEFFQGSLEVSSQRKIHIQVDFSKIIR